MSKKNDAKKRAKNLFGTYMLPNGQSAVGRLKLKQGDTLLRLYSEGALHGLMSTTVLTGVTSAGKRVTLLDCLATEAIASLKPRGQVGYSGSVFPHYVAVGDSNLDTDRACVTDVSFSTSDLPGLFYDFDAFGLRNISKATLKSILAERENPRDVRIGDHPWVGYFTGRFEIIRVHTKIGWFVVQHRPTINPGSPKGFSVVNRMMVSLAFDAPVTFNEAMTRLHVAHDFLSFAAGRPQDQHLVSVKLAARIPERPVDLDVYESLAPQRRAAREIEAPRPPGIPLDPIGHPEEFKAVLANWIERHDGWMVARGRYLDCLRGENGFGPDRLVAAANMFDILPTESLPPPNALSPELEAARRSAQGMFRALPQDADRDAALSALGRIGQQSLPKKVAYRAAMVAAQLGDRFPELQVVARAAVLARNYFVHGSAVEIDPQKIEQLLPLLTRTLEFIFAASDFIEAGWDAKHWRGTTMGHNFARLQYHYAADLVQLKAAMAK